MRLTTALVLAGAGIAAAQSASSAAPVASGSPSGCGSAIDAIIQACLASTTPLVNKCAVQDWHCLCTQQSNVVTCYNNCPSDPNAFGAKQKETSYCNAAKTVPSSSAAAPGGGKPKATAAIASSSSGADNGPHTGFATGSASASASAAASGNAAAGLTPASGLLAAVFGLVLL